MSMVEALLIIVAVEMVAIAAWLALALRDIKSILTKLSDGFGATASASFDHKLIQEELLGAKREVSKIAREVEQAKQELLSGPGKVKAAGEPVDVDSILREGEGQEEVPLPVDPNNPPRVVSYSPKPGSPQRLCDCHGRVIEPRDKVLLWPNPAAEGAMWIFCESVGRGE